jgi:hypothetical protein
LTGTGSQRRRLTVAEAEAGALPEPFTRDEWGAMAAKSFVLCSNALWTMVNDKEEFEQELTYRAKGPTGLGGPFAWWNVK